MLAEMQNGRFQKFIIRLRFKSYLHLRDVSVTLQIGSSRPADGIDGYTGRSLPEDQSLRAGLDHRQLRYDQRSGPQG